MSEATLYRTTPRRAVRRRRGHVLREGITVGLIGAAIVMLWFFIVDLAAGVPLRTPALLGAALFQGARSAGETIDTTPLVVGYTAVHLAGFTLSQWLGQAVTPWIFPHRAYPGGGRGRLARVLPRAAAAQAARGFGRGVRATR